MLVCQPSPNAADPMQKSNRDLLKQAHLAREERRARKEAQEQQQMDDVVENNTRVAKQTEHASSIGLHGKQPASVQVQGTSTENSFPAHKTSSGAVAEASQPRDEELPLPEAIVSIPDESQSDEDDDVMIIDSQEDPVSSRAVSGVACDKLHPQILAQQSQPNEDDEVMVIDEKEGPVSSDVSAEWSCTACTLDNEASAQVCAACGNFREVNARPGGGGGEEAPGDSRLQKKQADVQRLRMKFPNHTEETIETVWEKEDGDLDECEYQLRFLVKAGPKSSSSEQQTYRSSAAATTGSSSQHGLGGNSRTDDVACENGREQENSDANRKRNCDGAGVKGSAHQSQPNESKPDPDAMGPPIKKARGRPKGSKDAKPRKRGAQDSAGASQGQDEVMDLTDRKYFAATQRCEGPQHDLINSQAPPPFLQRASAIARPAPEESVSRALAVHPPASAAPQTSPISAQDVPRPGSTGAQDRGLAQPRGEDAQAKGSGNVGHPGRAGPLFVLPPQEVWGKIYPDLRPWMSAELYKIARSKLGQARNDVVFHNHVRALMQIALYPHPVCKLAAALKIPEIGPQSVQALKDAHTTHASMPPPAPGKFAATAAAALVALWDFEQDKGGGGEVCSVEELLKRTQSRMDPRFPGNAMREADRDVGWVQVKKLMQPSTGNPQLIKEVKRNKQACFQLLDAGREVARTLLAKQWHQSAHGPMTHLHSGDGTMLEEFQGAVMAVDFREGGGMRRELFKKLCADLDSGKQPFFARSLPIADYLWLVHGNCVAPFLVERKAAEDLAMSIADGRWESQQNKMLQARSVYPNKMRLIYIIEGDAKNFLVDKKWVSDIKFRVTIEDVQRELSTLEARGFEVIRSSSIHGTVKQLQKIHKEVVCDARSGKLGSCLTFAQFDAAWKAAEPVDVSAMVLPRAPPVPVRGVVSGDHGGVGSAAAAPQGGQQKNGDAGAGEGTEKEELMKLSTAVLKAKCGERGEPISGKKAELVDRLLKPPRPEVARPGLCYAFAMRCLALTYVAIHHQAWLKHKQKGEYVPQLDSCNTAILVALLLHDRPMTEKGILDEAEETSISKEPMHAPKSSHYDGWSSHMKLIKSGWMNQQLVNKGKAQYTLTDEGKAMAEAMHKWAHVENLCKCGGDP